MKNILNLEKYIPRTAKEDYYTGCSKRYKIEEHQDMDLVGGLLRNKEAYKEFLTNVLIHVTGSAKLDKLYLSEAEYGTIVTASDEAYGMLLLEDKSLLWKDVLRRRMMPYFGGLKGNGLKSLGVNKEVFVHDKYEDKFSVWSNGGVLSPKTKKGWSNEGVSRFNEYMTMVRDFRASEEGVQAMKDQRRNWTQSLLVANRKRRSDMIESETSDVGTQQAECYQESWD